MSDPTEAHWELHRGKPHFKRWLLVPGLREGTFCLGGPVDCYLLECACGNREPLVPSLRMNGWGWESYFYTDDRGRTWDRVQLGSICRCGRPIPLPGEVAVFSD